MNAPGYRTAYLANLKKEVKNNQTNYQANVSTPAVNQYVASGNTYVGYAETTEKREHHLWLMVFNKNGVCAEPVARCVRGTYTLTNIFLRLTNSFSCSVTVHSETSHPMRTNL